MDIKIDGKEPENDIEARLKSQQATIDVYQRERAKLKDRIAHAEQFVQEAIGAVQSFQAPKQPARSRSKKRKPVVACLVLSDWHIGETVSPSETAGVNEYDWQIAQERMARIVGDFVAWITMCRASYAIDEVCVISAGDLVSGNIHQELAETNEFPPPVAAANAGNLLGWVYTELAAHFPVVRALQAGAGNHDRLTRKPRAKRRAEDAYTYIVHEFATARASAAKNVTVECPLQVAPIFDIAGHRVLVTHGNDVRGQMGIPYYGFARYVARHSRKEQSLLDKGLISAPTKYYIFGHFHHFAILDDGAVMMNPSLIGPNEYDETAQRFAEPAQLAFLVSPHHGAFGHVPFRGE